MNRRVLVGVDGVDSSGKTSFAAALAGEVSDRPTLVLHADDFLQPSNFRHRRGRYSPEGFWLDTYDYTALRRYVFEPLGPSGDGRYRPGSFDSVADASAPRPLRQARDGALILIEGMFLHRDELVDVWDYSIYLDVPFTETARRMALRDGSNPDPEHDSLRRYVIGQRCYFDAARPWERADLVIDNTRPTEPKIIEPDQTTAARSRHD